MLANIDVYWPLKLSIPPISISTDPHYSKCQNLRISMNPPFPPYRLNSRDPLLRQRLIPRCTKLKRITLDARLASIFGFDVQPEVVAGDLVVVDCGEELADLNGDGLAGHARWLGSSAYLRHGVSQMK